MIGDDGSASAEDRLLRAQIPAAMAIRLHEHKILTGRTIQDTVNEAIEDYLERLSTEGSA